MQVQKQEFDPNCPECGKELAPDEWCDQPACKDIQEQIERGYQMYPWLK